MMRSKIIVLALVLFLGLSGVFVQAQDSPVVRQGGDSFVAEPGYLNICINQGTLSVTSTENFDVVGQTYKSLHLFVSSPIEIQLSGQGSAKVLNAGYLSANCEPIIASDSSGAENSVCRVQARNVRVRSQPNTQSEILTTLRNKRPYDVIEKSDDGQWVFIEYQEGDFGWVALSVSELSGNCDENTAVQAEVELVATSSPSPTASMTASNTPTSTATATSSPTATNTATQTIEAQADQEPITTATATVTQTNTATVVLPSATFTPSFTPTATNTVTLTATFTPSYTPTRVPQAQVAPEDARFNNPLNIPLDNTASVLDFVSHPGGDREDRVSFSVNGMNNNAGLSGGRARLVISVSCFGQGVEHIQIFTGGQTYSCGQTIVDREVTANSDTGSVIITATGGEGTYVQWVLTGTATRIN